MAKVKLNLALAYYDRHQPLFSGEVQPEGIELNAFPMTLEEIFWRQAQFQEFDACEFSGGAYIILKARNANPFTAIPVFPSRCFRQNSVYINAHAGIERPEDVRGRRVGLPEYDMTAMFWIRDFMDKDYGVKPTDVEWVVGGQRDPGRKPRVDYQLPTEIRIHPAPEGRSLDDLLECGEIDVLYSARAPEPMVRGSRNIKRLFENHHEAAADYWRRTRLFPIMHTVVIRSDIIDRYPWVPGNLYTAFVKAKQLTIERLGEPGANAATLPFLIAHLDETRALMGEDFWPFGAEANRGQYGYLAKIAYEQHVAVREVPYEELYPKSLYDEFKV